MCPIKQGEYTHNTSSFSGFTNLKNHNLIGGVQNVLNMDIFSLYSSFSNTATLIR